MSFLNCVNIFLVYNRSQADHGAEPGKPAAKQNSQPLIGELFLIHV